MPPPTYIGSRVKSELPKLKFKTRRYFFQWEFDKPRRYLLNGLAGSGKSNLNENLTLRHKKILDIYGSKDNENLCWARKHSPIDDILMITGDNTDIDCSWDTRHISQT